MTDREKISNLKNGEKYIVGESDYGKAEIWLINDIYVLFSIPLYGGKPQYEQIFQKAKIDFMIQYYESWG